MELAGGSRDAYRVRAFSRRERGRGARGAGERATDLRGRRREPTRRGFFHELLFAAATSRTPRFDDYTRGSYHVNKLDLARGYPSTPSSAE